MMNRRSRDGLDAKTASGYQSGFGNEFATEAVAGTLPVGRNSPQKVAHGLYAEQISGTAFTAPRHANRRSWLYRIRPAALHGTFETRAHPHFHNRFEETATSPNQLRWDPRPLPTRRPISSMACSRWPATAARRRSPVAASTSTRRIARCRGVSSTTPTASC